MKAAIALATASNVHVRVISIIKMDEATNQRIQYTRIMLGTAVGFRIDDAQTQFNFWSRCDRIRLAHCEHNDKRLLLQFRTLRRLC